MRLVRVAVPVPALDALTYRVPEDLNEPLAGARVLVPLGKRTVTGVILDSPPRSLPSPEPAEARARQQSSIKDIIDVLDSEPFLNADVVTLVSWVSRVLRLRDRRGDRCGDAATSVDRERTVRAAGSGGERKDRGRTGTATADPGGTDIGKAGSDRPAGEAGYGIHAALLALERDGLIVLTQPLEG